MNPRLLEIAAAASALAAADRAGLLVALGAGADTAEGFARRLALHPRAVECVLEVLRAQGFAARDGATYAAHDDLRPELAFQLGEPGLATRLFSHTERFLRDASAHVPATDRAPAREKAYTGTVDYLAAFFAVPAAELAARLDPLGAPGALLDVGAGSAVWGLAQLARAPGARLTALDLPAILPRARAHAEGLGLADRLDLLPGDFHTLELPRASFDRVILANVVHLEPPDRAAALLQRVAPALRAGGHLIVVDTMVAPTPERDRAFTAYALFLALRITGGRPHPEGDLRRWLAAAGLEPGERLDLSGPPVELSALLARAP